MNNKTETSGFLQVVPTEPPQPVPRSFEELRAEISAHLGTCQICRETPIVKYHCGASVKIEPGTNRVHVHYNELDPVIVQTTEVTLRLSEIPDPSRTSTDDGLVNDDPSVDLSKPQDAVKYYLDGQGIPVNAGAVAPLTQVANEGVTPTPQLCVPEEFPLAVDMGKMPWSKVPIREISPLVWFKYEKAEGHNYIVYDLVDGNNRHLVTFDEEGIANFFVNAANIYVHASLTTQV